MSRSQFWRAVALLCTNFAEARTIADLQRVGSACTRLAQAKSARAPPMETAADVRMGSPPSVVEERRVRETSQSRRRVVSRKDSWRGFSLTAASCPSNVAGTTACASTLRSVPHATLSPGSSNRPARSVFDDPRRNRLHPATGGGAMRLQHAERKLLLRR